MVYTGRVVNGVVVLETDQPPPEGTRVRVETVDGSEAVGKRLLRFAGTVKDLPADMAEQHDHYIHGTRKR